MVLFACFFVQSAGAALHHAVVLQHRGNGAKEAFHIQPKAQMLHIPAVQLGLLGNFQLVAPLNKQIKITGETIYLFAPLAYRLGLYSIKSELEDLCMKYRFPQQYAEITQNSTKARPRAGSSSTSSTPRSSRLSTATTSTTKSRGA